MPIEVEEHEVIIVGGGPAGFVAALAAARSGADALLVERMGFLGGNVTAGLVTNIGTFHNQLGEQVVRGIPQEIVDRTLKMGAVGHVPSPTRPGKITVTGMDEEIFKQVAVEMLEEAGVSILLYTFAFDALVKNCAIRGIEVANKSGRQTLLAKAFVDATGDGDIAAAAGAPYVKGRKEDGLLTPVTTIFKATHVDIKKTIEYMLQHPDQFKSGRGWGKGYDPTAPVIFCNLAGFVKEWKEAVQNGKLSPEIDVEHSSCIRCDSSRPDEVYVNMTRVIKVDSTNARSLTYGEIAGRKQAVQCINWMKRYIPGFEQARFTIAPHVGIREGRRIVGEYILSGEDVIKARKFSDVVGKGGVGLDFHDPTEKGGHRWVPIEGGGSYDIPYRCIMPKQIDNLLAAGRCVSADDEAFTSIRWAVPCMVTGQAAGTAAALSARENIPPRQLDVSEIQEALLKQGVVLYGTR